jgi:hypothetical protein
MKRHSNKKKSGSNNEYLRDLNEWSGNRYNPGFYTGGQLPPEIKYPSRRVGFLIFSFGLLCFILAVASTTASRSPIGIGGQVVFYLVAALQLYAGVSLIFKKFHRRPKLKKDR